MYIGEIIAATYSEVEPTHTIRAALNKIDELHYQHLPVVQGTTYLGLVKEEDLLAVEDDLLSLSSLERHFSFLYIHDYQHLYDAMQVMSLHNCDILPVLDKDHHYVGIINREGVLSVVSTLLGNQEPGAIAILEMDAKDYSLSQLSHIVEAENVKILSLASRRIMDTERIEVCLKFNKTNVSALIASLWRFNYLVKATFNDGSDENDINDRYQLLMHYLDI